MRFLIHDFAGHPFQIQLSRELALRGNEITHVYPCGLPGPKGRLHKCTSDPESLEIKGLPLSNNFRKYSPYQRFIAHRTYAEDLRALISDLKPDAVLSGNTPIDIQTKLLWHCHRNGIGFVHWVQDVYCQAIEFFLSKKIRWLSKLLSAPFRVLEKRIASSSDSTVVISPAFRDLFAKWGLPEASITVVENWAPLDEVKLVPRQNSWRQSMGFGDKTVLLYSGTLGLKHRPDLLYRLAETVGDKCVVVVISEGIGRDYLERLPKLNNLLLLGFRPYERLSEVLASADILVATLESDAGQFAVPSKILTYLCAGRPLLVAAPNHNLAATVIERSEAGVAVDPDDTSAWTSAAKQLVSDPERRKELGIRARKYAERHFDIESQPRSKL